MRHLCLLIWIFFSILVHGQTNRISLIPQPVTIISGEGHFQYKSTTRWVWHNQKGDDQRSINQWINKKFDHALIENNSTEEFSKGNIHLVLMKDSDTLLGNEGYRLDIRQDRLTIEANKTAGLFYGLQSLLQLFPVNTLQQPSAKISSANIPVCKIQDKPRFQWRGLMLDVSRHFFTKEEVKHFIEEMAAYKFNILHWHLTDDQGWRLEIKSLPKLTEVGAWRAPRVGRMSQMTPPKPDEPLTYGGFYTQDDVKEIVAYAKDHYVQVMPEIDVPGHSMALVAAYPEMSGTPGTYRVNSGEKNMNWFTGGFSAIIDNTISPVKEVVYENLDKIMGEVASLFPFEYIHMGGDECAKNYWEKQEDIKLLMKQENLKDLHEVQSYFVKRMAKIIQSKGKKMMGWDEILEGGLADSAAVMSWRGDKGGIEASKLKHPVVMSPSTYAYLDYNQGESYIEPPIYASLRLRKTYQFDPIPAGADARYILGGQANLWTEQIPSYRSLQYMLWPRGMAIAESVWSPVSEKNWPRFVDKVEHHFERLDAQQIKHANTIYDPIITTKKNKEGEIEVYMETEISGLSIYYSFDETHPDNFYPMYQQPVTIPKDAIHLKVVTYRNGKQIGRQIDLPVLELNKRAGK